MAHEDTSYLVLTLSGNSFDLDLSAATGSFQAQWFDPRTGALSKATDVTGTTSAGSVAAQACDSLHQLNRTGYSG